MTKIKANEGYELCRKGSKWHLVRRNLLVKRSGCRFAVKADRSTHDYETADTIDLKDLCGHCRKLESAYTEVEPHAWKIGETVMYQGARHLIGDIDEGYMVLALDGDKYIAPNHPDNNCISAPMAECTLVIPEHIAAMPKGHRIMEKGETITAECKVWAYGSGPWEVPRSPGEVLDKDHQPHCCPIEPTHETEADLQAKVRELETKNQYLDDNLKDEKKCHEITINTWQALVEATRGHTPENVAKVMGRVPPAEDLEGCEVACQLWRTAKTGNGTKVSIDIDVVPIVQYIDTELITDELVERLGRIPCEVWMEGREKHSQLLVAVLSGRFRTLGAWTVPWDHCRITQDTIDKLEKEQVR